MRRNGTLIHDCGKIDSGYFADLLVLNSNPLDNIAHASEIDTVIKNGVVYPAGCPGSHSNCLRGTSTCRLDTMCALSGNPFSIPIEVAFETVNNVARFPEPMELAGVNDQLGRDSETAQGLIHLFAVKERDVEVALAAKEKRGRFDPVSV